MVKPKKHLGQHFLKDKNIALKIASCLPSSSVSVVELGPGTGILTQALLENESIKHLKLVEIDTESVAYLQTHFNDPRIEIIASDFLKLDLSLVAPQPFALIGNYPYNISSQIFFKALEYKNIIPVVTGMIQKEVADRIVANPGNKAYGILSVLLQTWYDIEYCFTVSEKVFFPPPKVKSAVIKMVRNGKNDLGCDEQLFKQVVKIAFNQRRKTLRNSLTKMLPDTVKPDKMFDLRPEQLSVEQFIQVTTRIEQGKA